MELFAIGAIIFFMIAIYSCIMVLNNKQPPQPRSIFLLGASASLCQLLWLGGEIVTSAGLNLSIINVASLVTLFISILMTLSISHFKILPLLPMSYGVATLSIILSYLLPGTYISHLSNNPALVTHIILTLFAYTCFIIASLLALQMAYLDYQLKHKRAVALHPALPSLMTVEKLLVRALSLGMLLLSISLLIAFNYFDHIFDRSQGHKSILSLFAWLFYAVLLWGHFRQGWRSNKMAFGTLFATLILSLAYFGSRVVKEVLLS